MRRVLVRASIATLFATACALTGFALAASATAATAATDATAAKAVAVKIDNFSFVPADLKIPRGTKVTWTNADDVPHVVLTVDRTVKSPPLDTDETFSFTFDKAGTYRYFCSIHPRMTGTIVVE